MFPHPECRMRNKQSLGRRNWTWSMLSLVCYMRLYPMLRVRVLIPRSSLDHMPMALWVVQVRNLQVRLRNKLLNCQSTNLPRDKLRLRLSLPKRWMYLLCNRLTRRVTSNLDNRKKGKNNNNKKGENANNNDKNAKMMGGTSRINVRLSFLASYARMITSLTCAREWMKLRSS